MNDHPLLFNKDEIQKEWESHWWGMPEFVQNKKEPHAKIIVRFESEDDLQDFARIIGQKLTKKTKSIWHPFKSHWRKDKQPVWKSES